MNIGDTVFAALDGLVSNRCYPNTFPQEAQPTWPAIRYSVISRDPDQTIDGTDNGDSDDIRVQVDFVATSYEAARTLRNSGDTAMRAITTPPCVRVAEFETYDVETKTHRFVVDYLFHPSTPA